MEGFKLQRGVRSFFFPYAFVISVFAMVLFDRVAYTHALLMRCLGTISLHVFPCPAEPKPQANCTNYIIKFANRLPLLNTIIDDTLRVFDSSRFVTLQLLFVCYLK